MSIYYILSVFICEMQVAKKYFIDASGKAIFYVYNKIYVLYCFAFFGDNTSFFNARTVYWCEFIIGLLPSEKFTWFLK